VEYKKTGDSGTKNTGKNSDASSRSSGHNSGESSHGGARNKASERDRTKSGHGRSSDSTGTGKKSAREPPPCLNTKKCAGEKHYLSDCLHIGKDEAMALLSKYKKKRDADKKKANFKTLGKNGTTTDKRDDQTAYLTAEDLGVKVTVLVDTAFDYSAIPSSAVEDKRKRGFPRNVEVLPEPIMLNMAIRGESDKQKCRTTEMLMSAVTITTPLGPLCMHGLRQIIVEEDMDHPLIGRPALDEKSFVESHHLDTCTNSATLASSYWRWASSRWAPCQSFYSSLQTFQSLLRTCRMCFHFQRKKTCSVGSRGSRTRLMKTSVKHSGEKMMTGTMTCYCTT
jgi:hypothetical protein